jgi:iron(III) transport system ATP-binding protein
MPRQLDVREVSVAYANDPVVRNVSFTLSKGSIGCLLGPSGCGKTTLLRAIAGFEPVSGGEIHLQGRMVSRSGQTLAPEQRRVGMVFQDFALFPHLNVERNISFGLRHLSRQGKKERVTELLRLVGLEQAGKQYPHHLSGGMQQRVAVARAIAPRPDILLLDEPFSSVDAELREQLAREVRELLKRDGITAILVTHDQLEAFAMADLIGVLGNGKLRQWGTGFDLYHEPADRFVADFIGQGIMLPGRVTDERQLETELGPVSGRYSHGLTPGRTAELLIRPDDVIHDDASPTKAEVVARAFRGAEYLYSLRLPSGIEVLCLVQSHHDHAPGEHIGIRLELEHLVAFPTDVPSSGAEGGTLSVVS